MSLLVKVKPIVILAFLIMIFIYSSAFAQEKIAPASDSSSNIQSNTISPNNALLNTEIDQNYVNIKAKAIYGKEFSTIEDIYNGQLKQFGYDLFGSSASLSSGMASSGGYTIQKGDRLKLYFWGDTLEILKTTGNNSIEPIVDAVVNKNGQLFLPGIGVIDAEGNSLSRVESNINAQLSARYANVKVKVNIDDPRNFPVIITGKVQKPGTVFVNDSSGVLDAINFAGGIKKIGSLREIIHIDSYTKKKSIIDLYDLIIKGDYPTIHLKKGDVILVKPIGKVVGIGQGVKDPAIYEFKQKESLKDLINYAGGFLPSINPENILVERFDINSNEKNVEAFSLSNLSNQFPNDGDLVSFNSIYSIAENSVKLEGNVETPQTFEYEEGMRLSDILKSKEELLTNTDLEQAVITRFNPSTKMVSTIPISLSAFFNGATNPVLKPQDIIKIYPNTKMGVVEVAGQVSDPTFIPYRESMKLTDVFNKVDFKANPNELVVEVSDSKDNLKTVYLYDLLTKNNNKLNLDLKPNDKIFFRLLTKKDVLKKVEIMGYVNKPGTYNLKPGFRLNDLIKQAGGLDSNAYLRGMVFLRPSVTNTQKKALEKSILNMEEEISLKLSYLQQTNDDEKKADIQNFISNQRELLNIMKNKAKQDYGRILIVFNIEGDNNQVPDQYNIKLMDGDQIIIPYRPNHVTVMGEVINQSSIAYIDGMNPKYYIDQVGGMTKQAYKKGKYLIRLNGTTVNLKKNRNIVVEPGDSIVVPQKIKIPNNWGRNLRDTVSSMFQTAAIVFMLIRI